MPAKSLFEPGRVCLSLAAFPGLRHEEAAHLATQGAHVEPMIGRLSCSHLQLVPQNFGVLTEDRCRDLQAAHPGTRFRLHANVRIQPRHVVADLSGLDLHLAWFIQAARVHRALGAEIYSAHAGRRREASLDQLFSNAQRAGDLFGCPVAIEGHYPTPDDQFLVASWKEYQQLLDSDLPFAVDLSHLHIVATRSGCIETNLVKELLASEHCLEVHVSDNDGQGDQHRTLSRVPWWAECLPSIHPKAVVFSEGNHRFLTQPQGGRHVQ